MWKPLLLHLRLHHALLSPFSEFWELPNLQYGKVLTLHTTNENIWNIRELLLLTENWNSTNFNIYTINNDEMVLPILYNLHNGAPGVWSYIILLRYPKETIPYYISFAAIQNISRGKENSDRGRRKRYCT